MSQDWPAPQRSEERAPLPRIDDLPLAEQGYEPERVEEAFDAFYRHLAQLDSTLRTLETVELFREQATALRADLRSIRAAGWSPYPRGYPVAPTVSVTGGLPEAVPRIALEVLFLIVVTVVVAVSDLAAWQIVLAMSVALAVTVAAEVLAGRTRAPAVRPVAAAPPFAEVPAADEPVEEAVGEEEPAVGEEPSAAEPEPAPPEPAPSIEAAGWAAYAEPSGPEALTVMQSVSFDEPGVDDAEPEPVVSEATAELEANEIAQAVQDAEREPAADVAEVVSASDAAPVDVEAEGDLQRVAAEAAAAVAATFAAAAREAVAAPAPRHGLRFWRRRAAAKEAAPVAVPPVPEAKAANASVTAAQELVERAAAAAATAAAMRPGEPQPVVEAAEPEPEPAPAPQPEFEEEPVLVEEQTERGPRRRLAWRRRLRREGSESEQPDKPPAEPAKHVRVLPPPEPVLERDLDPWERGFDFDLDDEVGVADEEEDELPLRRPPA